MGTKRSRKKLFCWALVISAMLVSLGGIQTAHAITGVGVSKEPIHFWEPEAKPELPEQETFSPKEILNPIIIAPDNDDIANATEISSLPYTTTQSTDGATVEAGEPAYTCGSSVGATVWYSFTPSVDGMFSAHTNSSDFDTVLHVFEDSGGLPQVVCNDDDITASDVTSRVAFEGQTGTTYLIGVGGINSTTGNLPLTFEQVCTDPNSLCVTAQYPSGEQLFFPAVVVRESDGNWVSYDSYNEYGTFTEIVNITPGSGYVVVAGNYEQFIVEEPVTAPGTLTAIEESPVHVVIETKDTSGTYLNFSNVFLTYKNAYLWVGATYENYLWVTTSPTTVQIDSWNTDGGYYFHQPGYTFVDGETISLDASILPYETIEMNLDSITSVEYALWNSPTYITYHFILLDGEVVHLVAPLDSSEFWAYNVYSIPDGALTWYYGFDLPTITMDTHAQNTIVDMGGALTGDASTDYSSYEVGEVGSLYSDIYDGYGNPAYVLTYYDPTATVQKDSDAKNTIFERTETGEIIQKEIVLHRDSKTEQVIARFITQDELGNPTAGASFYPEPQYYIDDADSNPVSFTEYSSGLQKYAEFTTSAPTGTWEGGFSIDTGPASGVIGDSLLFTVDPASRNDTIGLYNSTYAAYYLKTVNEGGSPDIVFQYGATDPTWIPLMGDWDGDEIDTVGVYVPSTSTFFFKDTNAGGASDYAIQYGPPGAGWVPLVGDWDGDGDDTLGLFDPTYSAFFLANELAGGAIAPVFYGAPGMGWTPLVGDWDGDGDDTLGLFDPTYSVFYLSNELVGGSTPSIFYGASGWTPIVGDWDGDGDDTIGVYVPSTSIFFLKNSNETGASDLGFQYGPPGAGWIPLKGRFE